MTDTTTPALSPAAGPDREPLPAVSAPARRTRGNGNFARYARSNQVRLGLVLVGIALLIAFLGPLLTPFDPAKPVGLPYEAPGGEFILGTDQLGRDVFSRVIAGGLNLAWMAPLCAIISVAIGALIGLLAAYFGRGTDVVLMRGMDVVLAFPGILLALLFVSMFGAEIWLLVILVSVAMIPGVSRVIRGAALPLNRSEYVLWARAVGMPTRFILLRCFLPNVMSPLMVELGVRLIWAVGGLAALSFIGYGIQPPTPDWGLMVSENRSGLAIQPWAVLAPIVMIVVLTIGGNLIAEGAARVAGRTEGKK